MIAIIFSLLIAAAGTVFIYASAMLRHANKYEHYPASNHYAFANIGVGLVIIALAVARWG